MVELKINNNIGWCLTSSLVTHCWDSWLRWVHTVFLRKFIRSFACISNICGDKRHRHTQLHCTTHAWRKFWKPCKVIPRTPSHVPLAIPPWPLPVCSHSADKTCLPSAHTSVKWLEVQLNSLADANSFVLLEAQKKVSGINPLEQSNLNFLEMFHYFC